MRVFADTNFCARACMILVAVSAMLTSSCGSSEGFGENTLGSVKAKNICEFSSPDRGALRDYFKNVLTGLSIDEAQSEVSKFGFPSLDKHPMSDKLSYTYVSCPIEHSNKNMWYLEFLLGSSAEVAEMDLYVFFEDENFERRELNISHENYRGDGVLKAALSGVARRYNNDWTLMKADLVNGGFSLRPADTGQIFVVKIEPDGWLSHRVLGLDEGVQAVIYLDEDLKLQNIK